MSDGLSLAPLSVEVKADTSNFETGMGRIANQGTETANHIQGSFKGLAGKLGNIGDNLTSKVSIPLIALGGIAAKIGMDFEAQMSRVQGISGATGDGFEKLKQQALNLGQSTSFSATEVAKGMENLASAGFNTNEIMQATPGLLDLAAASGEDLSTSSEIAASSLRAFGLEADKTGHIADILAKNAAMTNAGVKDTGEAMKDAAPVAHTFGLSMEETTAAIGEMANAGIKGGQAGTTLRGALTRLANPSKEAADTMKQLGFNAFDSSGQMKPLGDIVGELGEKTEGLTDKQKASAMATIFGQEALSGMTILVEEGKGSLDNLTESYKYCDGAAEDMANTMKNNTKASVEEAFGSLETASIKILQSLAPTIKSVADSVGKLADKFSAMSPETQKFIIALGGVAIATGPVMSKTAGIAKGLQGLRKTLGATSSAASALGTAGVGAGASLAPLAPVLLGVAGAAAAVGAGIYTYTKYSESMNSSMNKSEEELGFLETAFRKMNGVTVYSQEEMEQLGIRHKKFSKEISPETAKSLEILGDKITKVNQLVSNNVGLGKLASKKDVEEIKKNTDDIFKGIIDKINANTPKAKKEMEEAFNTDGIIDKNEKKILDAIGKGQEKQKEKIKKNQDRINEIYEAASARGGKILKSEQKEIQQLFADSGKITANLTAKNKLEMQLAEKQFQERIKSIDEKGLSELLKQKVKERDSAIQISKEKYDRLIVTAQNAMPGMSEADKKLTEAQIKKWEKAKDTEVQTEKNKYLSFIDTANKEHPKIMEQINTSTGEILTAKQKSNQADLEEYMEHMEGMKNITKDGYYKIKNTTTGEMKEVSVDVDENTGKIVGAWQRGTVDVMGNPMMPEVELNPNEQDSNKFKPLKDKWLEKKKTVNESPMKPKVNTPSGNPFSSFITNWNNTAGYILSHPIRAFMNMVHGESSSSNYNGLDYVPYDGYVATLHKGERILTADESNALNTGNNGSTTINFNGTYGFNNQKDIDYFMNQAALKIQGAR